MVGAIVITIKQKDNTPEDHTENTPLSTDGLKILQSKIFGGVFSRFTLK